MTKLYCNHLQTTNQCDESANKSLRCKKTTNCFFHFPVSERPSAAAVLLPVTSPMSRPSASAHISFQTVDKAAAFNRRVTRAATAVIIFLFLSRARRRKQHPRLTDMETSAERAPPGRRSGSSSAPRVAAHGCGVHLVRISGRQVIDLEDVDDSDDFKRWERIQLSALVEST